MAATATSALPTGETEKPPMRVVGRRMSEDIGEMLHSPSTALMTLVDCDHQNDFEKVCEYLSQHAMEVVREVHGEGQPRHEGRLTIDNHRVMLNCPPAPESGDDHGHILIKTFSERACELGISMRREFRVCDESNKLHVREDVCKGGNTMSHLEARVEKKYLAATTTAATITPIAAVAAKAAGEDDGAVAQEETAEPTTAKNMDAGDDAAEVQEQVVSAPVSS